MHKPQGTIPEECRNDFLVCLETGYALDLLQSTFPIAFQPENLPQRIKSVINPIRVERQALRPGRLTKRQFPDLERFIHYLRDYKEGNVVIEDAIDHCVVINLCRPFASSLHHISIHNGDVRSHSNLSEDPNISILSGQHLDNTANESECDDWCPSPPFKRSADGPDFVTLTRRTGRKTRCVVGVAVKATGSVAVRVELQNVSGDWLAVDGGALLRPDTIARNLLTQPNINKHVQLISFRKSFRNFPLQSARITVVECDGQGVRVGLLVSHTDTHDHDHHDRALSRHMRGHHGVNADLPPAPTDVSTDISARRTEAFANSRDYYDWWYRLQRVRTRLVHLSPLVDEGVLEMNERKSARQRARRRVTAANTTPWCNRYKQNVMISSVLAYAILLLMLFPGLLIAKLDQVSGTKPAAHATNANNTTSMSTTPHYSIVSPNPHRTMRTTCWRHTKKPKLEMPWSAVFAPFWVAMLTALGIIVGKFLNIRNARRRLGTELGRYRMAEQDSRSCRQKVHARIEAKLLAEAGSGRGVSGVVQAVVDDSLAASVAPPPPFEPMPIAEHDACLERHFFDLFVLIIGLVGLVVYGVADWGCYFGDMDSQAASVAVLCILAALCVAMDMVVGVQFVRFLLSGIKRRVDAGWRRNVASCTSFALFGVLMLQQVLLLLKMFTLFDELSFFFVFSPLLVAIVMLDGMLCCLKWNVCGSIILCAPFLTSVVLLMSKADEVFGVGAVSVVPLGMTWSVVMVPVWLAMATAIIGLCNWSAST